MTRKRANTVQDDSPPTKKPRMTNEGQEQFDAMYKVLQDNLAKTRQQFAEYKKGLPMEAQMRGIPEENFVIKSDKPVSAFLQGSR